MSSGGSAGRSTKTDGRKKLRLTRQCECERTHKRVTSGCCVHRRYLKCVDMRNSRSIYQDCTGRTEGNHRGSYTGREGGLSSGSSLIGVHYRATKERACLDLVDHQYVQPAKQFGW